eukprot:77638_1
MTDDYDNDNDTLAVEVEPDEQQYGNVTDDRDESNDEAIRAEAGLNSPKNPQQMQFDEDDDDGPNVGGGMTLNLGDVSDDDDEQAKVTPNTKRDQMGVNSPREKHQNKFPQKGGDSSALNSLVTQVARDDGNSGMGGGGAASLVTQVPRPDDDQTEEKLKAAQTSGGICACFSCLWSCCSGPQPPEPVPMQPTTTPNKNQYNAQATGDGGPTTKKTKENANSRLLDNGGGDQKDPESVSSSTEYDVSLLPPLKPEHIGKKCLILDLDETLVHSSFKPIPKPDFIIPVEIDRVVHHVYVLKRPYVDEFLLRVSKHYELVIFTASLSKYADPLLDKLDIHNVLTHRLFRESCVIHGTAYVKDLRKLGRKLKDSIIVDNSPPSYLFQPTNAVPITSWFDDQTDTQLLDFCGVCETTMKNVDDVRKLLDANNKSFRWLCNQKNQPLSKYTTRNDQNH